MRKFLSILMLVCLLCGLALPAAAEGEPQLYAKVEGGSCTNTLTIAEGFTQTVRFYSDAGGTTALAGAPSITDETNISLTAVEDGYQIKANKVTEVGSPVSINADGYLPVSVNVISSQLEIKRTDGTWSTSLSGIKAGESVPVEFQLIASGETVPYTDNITVDKPDGLTISAGSLNAVKAGTYTLSCKYSGTVTVTVAAAALSADDLNTSELLNGVLQSKAKLEEYLNSKGYPTGGDITLRLPESVQYADPIIIGEGMNGVTLTLQGNKNTFKQGLVINGGDVCVDGIRFQRTDGRDVSIEIKKEGYDDVAIYNCAFSGSGYDFEMIKNSEQYVPAICLSGNTFSNGTIKASLRNSAKNILGYWDVTTSSTSDEVYLILDASVTNNAVDAYGKKYASVLYYDSNIRSLETIGWKVYFTPNSTFSTVYAAHEGQQIIGNDLALYQKVDGQNGAYYKFLVNDSGKYELVEDDAPVLKDGKVVISKSQEEHLSKVIVKCTYKAADVTFNNSSVPSTMSSDGYLSFTLKKPNGNGTYNVKEVTKTVTKPATTTTTRRSYNYKYQDYYLITPQRVTDCMRYAKDNLVTIECKEAGRRSISLPVASMAAAAEKGYSILLKNEKIANITMDPAALKSMAQQAKGTTVLLHYRSLNHKTLTTVGLASVQSHLDQFPNDNADLAFLLTATSDSETIEDLQLGTITLKIPFIVLPGMEEMKNEVYALQTETSASARETTVADGHLTTKLTDLTEHMVFQIGEPVETTEETTEPTVETTVETTQPETEPETVPETTLAPEPEAEEKGFPVWIPIVAVLLLGGGGAAAWFLYFRKRFKK